MCGGMEVSVVFVFVFKNLIHIIAETGQFEIYAAGQHTEDPGQS